MVYECDQCQTPLPPNETRCPKCGEIFDEPVPADAEVPRRGFSAVGEVKRDATSGPYSLQNAPVDTSSAAMPPAATSGRYAPAANPWKQKVSGPGLLAIIILIGIGFFVFGGGGNNGKSVSPTGTLPAPVVAPQPALGSDVPAGSDADDSASPPPADVPQLVKGSEHFGKESDYDVVTGEITNMGNDKLDNVEATTTFYDSSGNVVKTTDALIDFNPLMPGQTSPYKTMETDNPLIKTEKTEFHSMGGPLIPYSLKSESRKVGDSDVASGDDTGKSDAVRDPVSGVAAPGSGLSDRPLRRNVLESTKLTESDLTGKSLAALSVSYNTIYAVHGYIFKRRSLQHTFDRMPWYHPNPSFAEMDLNQLERSNLKTIRDYERKEYHY